MISYMAFIGFCLDLKQNSKGWTTDPVLLRGWDWNPKNPIGMGLESWGGLCSWRLIPVSFSGSDHPTFISHLWPCKEGVPITRSFGGTILQVAPVSRRKRGLFGLDRTRRWLQGPWENLVTGIRKPTYPAGWGSDKGSQGWCIFMYVPTKWGAK